MLHVTFTVTGPSIQVHTYIETFLERIKGNDRQMATDSVVKRLLAAKYFCYFNKMNALILVIITQALKREI